MHPYLWLATIDGVLELKECLAYGIGIGHLTVVNKGDVFDAPSDEVSRDLAAECACSEHQYLQTRDCFMQWTSPSLPKDHPTFN